MITRPFIFFSFLLFAACADELPHTGQEVGANGEPPKALVRVYGEQFLAEDKNYVLALGLIHTFLVENQFSTKYTECFDDVLDVRKRNKKGFSCIVLQAEQGPPTKVYFRVIVDEVLFNQLDENNRLFFSVEMYVLDGYVKSGVAEQLIQAFETGIGTELSVLHSGE